MCVPIPVVFQFIARLIPGQPCLPETRNMRPRRMPLAATTQTILECGISAENIEQVLFSPFNCTLFCRVPTYHMKGCIFLERVVSRFPHNEAPTTRSRKMHPFMRSEEH